MIQSKDGAIDLLVNPQSEEEYNISLYAADGHCLSNNKSRGEKRLRFGDYKPLPAGTYVIVLKMGDKTETVKVVVG